MKFKTILLTIVLAFIATESFASFSSYGYTQKETYYDKLNDRLFIGINEITKGTFTGKSKVVWNIVNLMIYDIKTKKSKLIFPENHKDSITYFIFENYYDNKTNDIMFNISLPEKFASYPIQNLINNDNIQDRPLVDSLLFVIKKDDDNFELWKSKKDGSDLNKIASFERSDSWHLDVGNKVIRIIYQKGPNTEIKEIDWN